MKNDDFINEFQPSLISYEKIKDEIFILLTNQNQQNGSIKYKTVGDLTLTPAICLVRNDEWVATAFIKEYALEYWGKTKEEIFEVALENSMRERPPRLYDINKLILDGLYEGDEFMESDNYTVTKMDEIRGLCVSTPDRTKGGVAIFYPGVAKKLSEIVNDDLYIVFTSLHEVMIHSTKSNPNTLKEALFMMLTEENDERDFASDKVYMYKRETDEIVVVE